MRRAVSRLTSTSSVLLVCDTQERFRGLICDFDSIITTAKHLLSVSNVLDIPALVTEQYPAVLGSTVKELQSEIAGKMGANLLALQAADSLCGGVGAINVCVVVMFNWWLCCKQYSHGAIKMRIVEACEDMYGHHHY